MNNYDQFINQEIINSSGIKGLVVALTNERITIEFPNERKIFKPDLAFKSSSIKFVNETLNAQMMLIINGEEKKEEEHQLALNKINEEAKKRNRRACDRYIELEKKDKELKRLFGQDFDYPPFEIFKKKFPHSKRRKTDFERTLDRIKWCITRDD